MPYFGIFGLEFEKAIAKFETSALKFALLGTLAQKLKFLNLGPKMSDLRIFGMEFENTIVVFEISLPEFVCCKVWLKIKVLKIGTINGIFGLKFENNIVVFEISTLEFA